jgi:hypothetical protein
MVPMRGWIHFTTRTIWMKEMKEMSRNVKEWNELPLLKQNSTKWFCNLRNVWIYGQSEPTLMLPPVGDVCDWMTIGFSLVLIHVLTNKLTLIDLFILLAQPSPSLIIIMKKFKSNHTHLPTT